MSRSHFSPPRGSAGSRPQRSGTTWRPDRCSSASAVRDHRTSERDKRPQIKSHSRKSDVGAVVSNRHSVDHRSQTLFYYFSSPSRLLLRSEVASVAPLQAGRIRHDGTTLTAPSIAGSRQPLMFACCGVRCFSSIEVARILLICPFHGGRSMLRSSSFCCWPQPQCPLLKPLLNGCKVVRRSGVQCSIVLRSGVQCSIVLRSGVQCSIVLRSGVQCSKVLRCAVPCRGVQISCQGCDALRRLSVPWYHF